MAEILARARTEWKSIPNHCRSDRTRRMRLRLRDDHSPRLDPSAGDGNFRATRPVARRPTEMPFTAFEVFRMRRDAIALRWEASFQPIARTQTPPHGSRKRAMTAAGESPEHRFVFPLGIGSVGRMLRMISAPRNADIPDQRTSIHDQSSGFQKLSIHNRRASTNRRKSAFVTGKTSIENSGRSPAGSRIRCPSRNLRRHIFGRASRFRKESPLVAAPGAAGICNRRWIRRFSCRAEDCAADTRASRRASADAQSLRAAACRSADSITSKPAGPALAKTLHPIRVRTCGDIFFDFARS